jgi:hypothetical protein
MLRLLQVAILVIIICCAAARPPGQINTDYTKMVRKQEGMKMDRIWKQRRAQCQRQECGKLVKEEAYNCVDRCVSPECYDEIYGDNPLEDGEIDNVRYRQFTGCVRLQTRNELYPKR